MTAAPSILLLGVGNVLWADEGFGVRVVEALNRDYLFPENVVLMDGGTQGIYLLQHVQAAEVLVVFDAIDYGLAPGTLKLIEGGDVPKFLGAKKMSLHQTGFQEVLATAELLGRCPRHLLLVGVQPVELDDYGGSLRPAVRAQIGPAMDAALTWLARFQVPVACRCAPPPENTPVTPPALEIGGYEAQRPSEAAACRVGDARVLHSGAYRVEYRRIALDGETLAVDVDAHLDKYR
jgi:hydrogenase maturation protease